MPFLALYKGGCVYPDAYESWTCWEIFEKKEDALNYLLEADSSSYNNKLYLGEVKDFKEIPSAYFESMRKNLRKKLKEKK